LRTAVPGMPQDNLQYWLENGGDLFSAVITPCHTASLPFIA
jgi:hypothetical protein